MCLSGQNALSAAEGRSGAGRKVAAYMIENTLKPVR
jgi:hypothetical protein